MNTSYFVQLCTHGTGGRLHCWLSRTVSWKRLSWLRPSTLGLAGRCSSKRRVARSGRAHWAVSVRPVQMRRRSSNRLIWRRFTYPLKYSSRLNFERLGKNRKTPNHELSSMYIYTYKKVHHTSLTLQVFFIRILPNI